MQKDVEPITNNNTGRSSSSGIQRGGLGTTASTTANNVNNEFTLAMKGASQKSASAPLPQFSPKETAPIHNLQTSPRSVLVGSPPLGLHFEPSSMHGAQILLELESIPKFSTSNQKPQSKKSGIKFWEKDDKKKEEKKR